MDKIYAIASLHIDSGCITRKRIIGWFPILKTAEFVITFNAEDIHRDGYNHCVIEEMPSGIYPSRNWEKWFKWEEDKFLPADRPNELDDPYNRRTI